jgi:protoporphyrinogen oxidase
MRGTPLADDSIRTSQTHRAASCRDAAFVQPSHTEVSLPHPAPRLPSFLMAGFEGADHRNSRGEPVAMLDVTGHARAHAASYARLAALGIRVVRESIGWSRAERHGRFDFSCALRRAEAARDAGITVIWTLWHYGVPDDVDLLDERIIDRFAAFAHAAAVALRDPSVPQPILCPVNEISFLAWAVCESSFIHPHRGAPGTASSARGFTLKRRLVRAALAGCDAIRAAVPDARLLHIDPLIHVVAPAGEPSRAAEAAHARMFQFQAWDMLTGRLEPELGGAPRYVDYVGVNYYHANQFEIGTDRRLHWHLCDPRRMPFRALLQETYARYRRPLLIAETSHFGIGRGRWLADITHEVKHAMREGVDVQGLCLYPIVDRPDWEALAHWHHSGLWDRCSGRDEASHPRLDLPYLRALRHAQHAFDDDARARSAAVGNEYALVVFAAGSWSTMRKPQRATVEALARSWTIVVVERGVASEPSRPAPQSPVAIVNVPAGASDDGAHDDGAAAAVDQVLAELASRRITAYGAWLHTPLALPILEHLTPDVVAYTPFEQSEAGPCADPRSKQRDIALRCIADIVGEVSSPAIERARRLPRRSAARAMLVGGVRDASARGERQPGADEEAECVIVGAGVAGLCAAVHYGARSLLLERDFVAGASRRSVADGGFLFDSVPHVLDGHHAFDDLYRRLLGDNVTWREPRMQRASRAGIDGRSSAPAAFRSAWETDGSPVGYPLRGGTQALIDGFLPLLDGEVLRGANVVRILPRERSLVLDDLRRIRYVRLIVTLSLPVLVDLCDEMPDTVADAASRLRALSLRCVSIGARGTAPVGCDWLTRLDDAIVDRIAFPGNLAPSSNRSGAFMLACEIVHGRGRPLALHGSALVRRCVDDCVRAGFLASPETVIVTHETDLPHACVIDDDPGQANLRTVEHWLDAHGIGFTGSRGQWEPGRCRHLLASGRDAAHAAKRSVARAAARVREASVARQ